MTIFGRAILFLSAFLPVFPLIAFRSWQKNQPLAMGFLIAAGLILLGTLALIAILRRGTPRNVKVATSGSKAESVVGFITGYLLPASLIDGSDISIVTVNVAAFVFLLLVAVRTHLVYFNPLLALFGLHLYEIETASVKGEGGQPDIEGEYLTVLVNDAQLRAGTTLAIYGAAGSIELAKVV